jgi:tRNA pseudouridine38-40 synthase
MRYACGVEYDGSGFCGWQRQSHARSAQADVEAAISQVANHPLTVCCAGRTDSGVHATAQVIHFETDARRSSRSWILGTNANLPADVRLLWIREVDDGFHARFTALARSYRYVILNREVPSALMRQRATWMHGSLDEARMREGAKYLMGEQDFSSFRALACQARSPVRTIRRLDISRSGNYLYLDVEANAFLHHMVRNIAGVLMTVGRGEKSAEWVRDILEKRDRTQGGVTAPSQGLYLVGVRYPERYGIAPLGTLPVFG